MATTRQRWLIGGAVALLALLLYSEHSSRSTTAVTASPSCTMKVTAGSMPVRSGPDISKPVVETYVGGSVVMASRTVSNGFRELGPDRWAPQEDLEATPGSNCG